VIIEKSLRNADGIISNGK